MAINPNIALQGQPVNMQQAIMGGLQTGEMIRQSGMRDALMRQQVQSGQQQLQQGQQSLQQGQQTLQSNTRAATAQKGLYVHQLASSLAQLPIQERANALARSAPQMQQMGIDPSRITAQDLSDQGLQQVITATKPFAQQAAGNSNLSVGASEVIQLEDGTPAFARQITDPQTGKSRIAVTPMPGKMVDTLGQTADQKTTREMEEYLQRKDIDIREFETRKQLESAYAQEIEKEKAEGKATVERTLAQDLADIERKNKRLEDLDARQAARVDAAIQSGLDASDQIPKIREGIEILKSVNTGGMTALSKKVTDFFGVTDGDVAKINQVLGQNVLAGLQAFGSQITEGERAFVMEIETSIRQGTEFNTDQLKRMERVLSRKINESMKAAKLAGDDYALEVIESRISGQGGSSSQQGNQEQPKVIDWSEM